MRSASQQAVALEVGRPQLEHERAQLVEGLLREHLQPRHLPGCRRRVAGEQRARHLGGQDEAEELLADGVVEIERQPVPLREDRELAALLVQAGVRDRDRRVCREQLDQLLVVVGEVGRAGLLRQVEGADHALGCDDRDAEERAHVGVACRPPAAELRVLVDVAGAVRLTRLEHRAEHAVLARQRSERCDEPVAHARREEAAEAAFPVGQSERGVPCAGKLARAVDQSLQHLVDREPGSDREHGVADRLERRADRRGHACNDTSR